MVLFGILAWLVTVLYLTVSILIGLLSLFFINLAPSEFDEYRSDDPWTRIETVASVMLVGPLMIPMALMSPRD